MPCSETDLVRLGIALNEPIQCRTEHTVSAIAVSPSLLLYSLHCFFCEHDAAPESPEQLASWFASYCCTNLKKFVAEWTLDSKIDLPRTDSIKALDLSSLENRPLKKSLVGYAKSLALRKPVALKPWVKTIVGKSLRGKDFVVLPVQLESVFKLVEQNRQLEDTFEERLLEEKLAAMKQLAYGASHEINNPLANISTRAQSLLTVETNPERRRKLAIIYEQAMRAHDMISDMMLFAHPPKLHLELLDVGDVARNVLREMRSAIRDRNATAQLKRYPGVEKIWIDPAQFSVALKALVRNSLEAIEARTINDGGRIIVRIWQDEGSLSVSIADNGAGMDERAKKHLFDPFFSGREAGRGLGFGLSKAWRVFEQHQGDLVWDQSYESGTQFIMRLPVKRNLPFVRVDKTRAA